VAAAAARSWWSGGGGDRGGRGGGMCRAWRRRTGGWRTANTGRRFNLNLGAQAQNLFNVVRIQRRWERFRTEVWDVHQHPGRPFSSGTAVRSITLQATLNF